MHWREQARLLLQEGRGLWDEGGTGLVDAAVETVRENWQEALKTSRNPEELQALWELNPQAAVEVVVGQIHSREVGELTDKEGAAKILACSVNHINNLVTDGHIQAIKVGKSLVRFDVEHLRDFIRRGGING